MVDTLVWSRLAGKDVDWGKDGCGIGCGLYDCGGSAGLIGGGWVERVGMGMLTILGVGTMLGWLEVIRRGFGAG